MTGWTKSHVNPGASTYTGKKNQLRQDSELDTRKSHTNACLKKRRNLQFAGYAIRQTGISMLSFCFPLNRRRMLRRVKLHEPWRNTREYIYNNSCTLYWWTIHKGGVWILCTSILSCLSRLITLLYNRVADVHCF